MPATTVSISWIAFGLSSLPSSNGYTDYVYMDYTTMTNEIRSLPTLFPGCARVFNAIERWPTLLSGNELVPVCGPGSCEFLVVEVGNESSSDQLFFSGEIHGDERVGPHAVLESVRNLCDNRTGTFLTDRLAVFMPLANPLGYWAVVREENNVDPNRDFPYDHVGSTCLMSLTARVIRRVFFHYGSIKSGITFHGGKQSITYPWGSYSHLGQQAPDDKTLNAIAYELQRVSGRKTYEVGSINDIVYPVHGGFEDWAYMLGFDSEDQCFSQSLSENIKLPSASIFLVEATEEKTPPEAELGSSNELWIADDAVYISPVPRCARMILKTIELVKPTATFVPINWNSSLVMILRGCISAKIETRVNCDDNNISVDVSTIHSCSNPIQFIKVPVGGTVSATSSIIFDPDLPSPGGYLEYAKNRTAHIAGSYRGGMCGQVLVGLYMCISSDTIVMHPYLVHHKPTISLMNIDGSVIFTISGLSQLVTEVIIDFSKNPEDLSVHFVSSSEPGFMRIINMSSKNPQTGETHDNHLLWLLFLLLLPISLLAIFLIRRMRKSALQTYDSVATGSP